MKKYTWRVGTGVLAGDHKHIQPQCFQVVFSPAERKVLRRRKKIPPSAWCEKHRILTMSSLPGPWRNESTPYLAGIMDASMHPSVQEVVICKSPQTGGSEAINNVIGYVSDRAPGPVLYVYPDELTAKENAIDRIGPMFTSSPRLRELMTGRDDDKSMVRIKLLSMPIYMAWASSVSRLANKPIRYLVFDETDKYQRSNRTETDPINLGEARTTTFRWNKKIWKISSPTVEAGYIWQAFLEAQVIFEYAVRCPECGCRQVMIFGDGESKGGIKWPEGERDANRVEIGELATYRCEGCATHWSDYQRDVAVRKGGWQVRGGGMAIEDYLPTFRPRRIAFHLPAWLSPFVSLSKIVGSWLRSKKNGVLDLNAHKDFCNKYLAEPWFHIQQDRQEDAVLALRDDRPAGTVPGQGQIAALLATVDTQDNGFWYEIRAVGYGQTLESWGVRHGFAGDRAALEEILFKSVYRDAAGEPYHVRVAAIDAMGHRTAEVYDMVRAWPGQLIPLKGERTMNSPIAWSNIEFYPGTAKQIPGGIKLMRVNTTFFKDIFGPRLDVNPGDPGAWHLHNETDERWAAMLCSEYRDEGGVWQCPPGKDNHAFDLGTYFFALCEALAIKFLPRPDEAPAPRQRQVAERKAQTTTARW